MEVNDIEMNNGEVQRTVNKDRKEEIFHFIR